MKMDGWMDGIFAHRASVPAPLFRTVGDFDTDQLIHFCELKRASYLTHQDERGTPADFWLCIQVNLWLLPLEADTMSNTINVNVLPSHYVSKNLSCTYCVTYAGFPKHGKVSVSEVWHMLGDAQSGHTFTRARKCGRWSELGEVDHYLRHLTSEFCWSHHAWGHECC